MNAVSTRLADNVLIFHLARLKEAENGAVGAISQLLIKTVLKERDVPIREMTLITVTIFLIPISAILVGNVSTTMSIHIVCQALKEKVLEATEHATNTALVIPQNKLHIVAISQIILAKNVIQTMLMIARRTVEKLVTTAKHHLNQNGNVIEVNQKIHNAENALLTTKQDVIHTIKLVNNVLHYQNSKNAI